eukprot:CAMPEP_0173284770 /NCGR_PEP_ID=MMETSP1143-20121109/8233_1 /TAXON_ID=483371 /ORGANISM="non described non described, Strain CCMP2298" /LENGTH=257 /DNA_ID=CAMNT_0014222835 /DNA_START=59 /DNA_END=828 /DNA_ORIENTATION=-
MRCTLRTLRTLRTLFLLCLCLLGQPHLYATGSGDSGATDSDAAPTTSTTTAASTTTSTAATPDTTSNNSTKDNEDRTDDIGIDDDTLPWRLGFRVTGASIEDVNGIYICASAARCLSSCERFALTASHAVVSEEVQKRWFLSVVAGGVQVEAEQGRAADSAAAFDNEQRGKKTPPQHQQPHPHHHSQHHPKLNLQLAPGANLYGAIELTQVPFTLKRWKRLATSGLTSAFESSMEMVPVTSGLTSGPTSGQTSVQGG